MKEVLFFENEESDEDAVSQIPDTEATPEGNYQNEETRVLLEKAIETLSPRLKEVIILHHKEGLDLLEIAEVLGKPYDTVKSSYRRALLMLRKFLNAPEGDITS